MTQEKKDVLDLTEHEEAILNEPITVGLPPEFKSEKFDRSTGYYKWGVAMLILCTVYVIFFTWYFMLHPTAYSLHDSIESIVGGAGILGSIAGVFYVLDNLTLQRRALINQSESINHQITQIYYQRRDLEQQRLDLKLTRKEIKLQTSEYEKSNKHYEDQSNIMRLQQYDNTFFNMLNHNKSLLEIMAFEASYFVKLLSNFKADTSAYNVFINHQQFDKISHTQHYPIYTLRRVLANSKNCETYIKNIANIIEFIDEKFSEFKNETFYHKVLYNNLSNELKVFLGLCIDYNLFEINCNSKFNYKEFYEKRYDLYKKDSPKFPVLYLSNSYKDVTYDFAFANLKNVKLVIDFVYTLVESTEFDLIGYNILATSTKYDAQADNFVTNSIFNSGYVRENKSYAKSSSIFLPLDGILQKFIDTKSKSVKGIITISMDFKYNENEFKLFQNLDFIFTENIGDYSKSTLRITTTDTIHHESKIEKKYRDIII